jgi:hypothetical protein
VELLTMAEAMKAERPSVRFLDRDGKAEKTISGR